MKVIVRTSKELGITERINIKNKRILIDCCADFPKCSWRKEKLIRIETERFIEEFKDTFKIVRLVSH